MLSMKQLMCPMQVWYPLLFLWSTFKHVDDHKAGIIDSKSNLLLGRVGEENRKK